MAGYIIAIPARFASTRLPGKPLLDVGGMPMIRRVCLQALKTKAERVVACVDSERVAAALEGTDAEVCMTPEDAKSGTDRIGFMIRQLGIDAGTTVVNIQGDEPLIDPAHIDLVANILAEKNADMSSLCARMRNYYDVMDPNIVKVVMDREGYAMYFSRAPIPYERDYFRDSENHELHFPHYHHFGLYAYKAGTVLKFLELEQSENELSEMLEQLRLMHYGFRIAMAVTDSPPHPGIDTSEDLKRVNAILAGDEA